MLRSVARVLAIGSVLAASTVVTSPARAVTFVVRPSDDATVEQQRPTTNLGSALTMVADSSPLTRSLLRFEVGPLSEPVTRATLRLYVTDKSTNGPELWRADPFEEETVTWATQPLTSGVLADLGSVSSGRFVEFDVTGVVSAAGTYAFALVADSTDGTDFTTDEASSNRPELVVVTAATTTTTTTMATTTTTEPGATSTTLDATTTTTTTSPSGTTSGRWVPTDDALVEQEQPTTNFGGGTEIRSDASPTTYGLLQFEIPRLSGSISRATLRLYVNNGTADGPELWRADPFNEATVTWNTAPAATSRVTDLGSVSSSRWLEIDVRSAVSADGGRYSFLLLPDSTDGIYLASGEAATNRPELVVEAGATPPPPPSGEVFQVGLLGDTGYNSDSEQGLLRTRSDMNQLPLAFAVHDGDIWGGSESSCSLGDYEDVLDVFDGFQAPFVYTPGDNEWEDCPEGASSRLAVVRQVFFADSQTLGQHPMTVTRQSGRVENARWTRNGVVFATMNEPGSSGSGGTLRDDNVAWLNAAFDHAEDIDAAGVMVFWQDNPFRPSGGQLARVLKDRALAFDRPVVLVHGDTHDQQIDHPWSDVDNFTRVETYGPSGSGDWVRATVDPGSPQVFSFALEHP